MRPRLARLVPTRVADTFPADSSTRTDINVLDGTEIYGEGHLVVYLNGNVLGLTRCAPRFVRTFRQLRRAGRINEFVSIYVNLQQQAIHIASDGGRICRPLIIVENGVSKVKEFHMKVRCRGRSFTHPHSRMRTLILVFVMLCRCSATRS